MEPTVEQRPYARARRPMAWAFGLSSTLIVLWLGAAAAMHELAELLFGPDLWVFGALVLPAFALVLNCCAFAGVFRGAGWAPGAALARAIFTVVAFVWLAWMGFWVVIAIAFLPPLGLPLLLPWGAELVAEVLFIIAWSRTRGRGEVEP